MEQKKKEKKKDPTSLLFWRAARRWRRPECLVPAPSRAAPLGAPQSWYVMTRNALLSPAIVQINIGATLRSIGGRFDRVSRGVAANVDCPDERRGRTVRCLHDDVIKCTGFFVNSN